MCRVLNNKIKNSIKWRVKIGLNALSSKKPGSCPKENTAKTKLKIIFEFFELDNGLPMTKMSADSS